VPQVLKKLSQLLRSKQATLTADDLASLDEDVRDALLDQRILVPSRSATHVVCNACHGDHVEEVTRIKDSRGTVAFRIRCPDAGWVDVPEDRLRQWTVDVRRLVAILAAAVGDDGSVEELTPSVAWRIGTIEIAGESFDVVFLRGGDSAQVALPEELARKHPPSRTILVAGGDVQFDAGDFAATIPLMDAFAISSDHVAVQVDRIRSVVSAPSIVTGNVFQRRGEFWQLSFDGETIFLKDSVGLGYIARLLMEPNRETPAVTLLAARAGIDPLVATGSLGEVLDDEARESYGRRYRELKEDLEEAKLDSDLGRVEKLETEMEQLTDELAKATGLRGNPRQKYDADRVRKSVSEAVRRDVARIAKEHDALARHLTSSITSGLTFRYAPDRDVDWLV